VPEPVGVPLIVSVFPENEAETPVGRPMGAPMPVAPVVENVINGEIAAFTQSIGLLDAEETVFKGLTVILPIAFIDPHPPLIGIV
jgi:hypothetical protein